MASDPARFRLGNLRCAIFLDGSSPLTEADVSNIFTKDAERMLAIFHAWPERLTFGINILLVEAGNERILVDSGIGLADKDDPGHLLDSLQAAGISPETIDTVIISHFHVDHIGGLLDRDGKAVFARARLVVPRREYDYWMNEQHLSTLNPDRAQRLRQTFAAYGTRLAVAEADAEIVPGICYMDAPGHTPGHSAILLESGGQRLLHFVDTLHLPIQLHAPDAVPSFDVQPEIAVASRRAVIERAVSENLLVMGYHLPYPGLYTIRQAGAMREWVAAELSD